MWLVEGRESPHLQPSLQIAFCPDELAVTEEEFDAPLPVMQASSL